MTPVGSTAGRRLVALLVCTVAAAGAAPSPAMADSVRLRGLDRVNASYFRLTVVITNSHCGGSPCAWAVRGRWQRSGRCDAAGEPPTSSGWFVDGAWTGQTVVRERHTLLMPDWHRGRFCFEQDATGTRQWAPLGSATLRRRRVCRRTAGGRRCRQVFRAVHHRP